MGEKRVGDNVFTMGDGGVPFLGVQKEATGAIATKDNTYVPLQVNASGQLRVEATVSPAANQTIDISRVGGNTAATAGAGVLLVDLQTPQGGGTQYKMDTTTASATGTLGIGYDGTVLRALLTDSSGRQVVNVAQIGGVTPATGGTGVISVNQQLQAGQAIATAGTGIQLVGANIFQVGGNTAATAGSGILNVGIANIGGTTVATGGTGVISINQQLQAGQAIATAGTGVQLVGANTHQVGGQTVATGGTGRQLISADIFQVGGSTTVTASAGIMRVQTVNVDETRNLFASGLAKIPQYAVISASAAGTADVIASASNTSYVILAYNLMSNGSCTAQFFSNSIVMSGKIPMVTGGVGKVCPYSPVGWMSASAGNNVKINLSVAAEVTGEIVYISV